jgi:hypothetical protein
MPGRASLARIGALDHRKSARTLARYNPAGHTALRGGRGRRRFLMVASKMLSGSPVMALIRCGQSGFVRPGA